MIAQLNEYFRKNLQEVVQSFEVLAEEYKNVFCRWETVEEAKQYFQPWFTPSIPIINEKEAYHHFLSLPDLPYDR